MTEQESLARYHTNVLNSAKSTLSLIDMILKAGPESGFTIDAQKLASIATAVDKHKRTVDAEIEDHCARFPDSEV